MFNLNNNKMKINIKEIGFEKEMTFSQILSSKDVEHWVEILTYNHSTVRAHLFFSNLGNAFGWKDGEKLEIEEYDGRRYLGNYPIYSYVAKYFCGADKIGNNYNVHHLNGDKTDDRACNLVQLTVSQHMKIERSLNNPMDSPESKAKMIATMKKTMSNPEVRALISKRTKEGMLLAKQRKQK